ncbi:unnamed protein product [Arabis nemorensis]|uniref:Retrotransposon gag domain-containing protein n=1 Tax=Arabis nemorensis TaxID=586526 RepID=A0A565BBU8_9BRAS|nr:unnamed protein product [Arabis nemorensis]
MLPKEISKKLWRGVIASLMIKEEPPDAQIQSHMNRNGDLAQGQEVLRMKLFQGRGYDEVIVPVGETELHQTCTNRIGHYKDTYAFLGASKINHEYSEHETTWETFSDHLQIANTSNQPNRSYDEGDIQFASLSLNKNTIHTTTNNYEGEFDKDRPWCEETDSQISLVETDPFDEEPWNNKSEPRDSVGDELKFEEEAEPFNNTNQSESWEYLTEDEIDFEPCHICFASHHQGPEAYLRWERDMKNWLQANQIPEEEKTSYAEDTLTEDAFRQWKQDAYARLEYDVPDASWEEMKQILRKEFVEDADCKSNIKIYTNPEPRRWILATKPNPKAKEKKASCPEPKKVFTSTIEEKTVDASRFASSINGGTRFLKKPCVTQDPTQKSKS